MKHNSNRMTFFFVVMFVFNMAANFVHPVTPTIIVDLGLNDYMFGLALAAMMVFNFLFSPFWGKIAGYISSKTTMLICGLGYALGQVFFGLAQTEIQFLLARMFAGIFVGGSYVMFLTYTVNLSTDENRGRNLTINAMLNAVSTAFGYFAGGMIGELNAYYAVWLQAGVLAFTSILHFIGCRDDRLQKPEKISRRQMVRQCNPFSAIAQCRYFMTRMLVFLFLSYGLANLGYIAFEQCFNYYLRDQFSLSPGYNGVIKAALGVISLISNSTLCLWIIRKKRSSPYLVAVMSVCTAAMIGVVACGRMLPFILVNVVFFAFYFISLPLEQNYAAELGKGKDSNLVMGAFNAVKSFGSIFGSALAGFIYKSPSSSSASVRGVKGLTVTVTSYSGSWAKISYQGRVGYMPIKYLNLVNRIKAYTTSSAAVYKSAGASSRMGTLSRGSTVYVIGVDGSYARVQDANGNVTGYIRSSQLSKTRPTTASSSVTTGTGSSSSSSSGGTSTRVPASLRSTVSSYSSSMSKSQKIEYAIYVAQNLDGKPYASNANPPKSFNCSIFVNYCMRQARISTKSNAAAQSNDSSMDKITSISSLKRGDIVCFNTNASDSDPVDHTGIYLGSGKFIHASSAAGEVRVDSLSSGFYKNCFTWARRP